MNKLIPRPAARIHTSPERLEEEPLPFLLSSPGETLVWFAVAIGLVLCLINGVQVALHNPNAPLGELVVVEALYVLALAIVVLIRRLPLSRLLLLLLLGLVLLLGVVLVLGFANLMNANTLGYVIFEIMPLIVVYRLAWRWSLPILGIGALTLAAVIIIHSTLQAHSGSISDVWGNLAVLVLVACIAGTLRGRSLLILQLRASQAQLRAEMERTAELAAARERASIARDIHDVLAHSLTVLSIQAQAARQVITQQPEQAAEMLDEMAGMLRESIAESRRVVGLLREATQAPGDTGPLGARLLALAERFAERTGMRCALEETGKARELNEAQENTLQFALQEALTNAYRHGSAQHVWIALNWQSSTVSLNVRDDGAGQPALTFEGQGGHGLRGMRERATALGGTLSACSREGGGFEVCLRLPVKIVDAGAAKGEI